MWRRVDQVQVMVPPSSRPAGQEDMARSLDELGLGPRAVVVATAMSEEQRAAQLQQVVAPLRTACRG